MAQYLSMDHILMDMFKAKCLTNDEYENLMKIRDSGQPNVKAQLCNEIAVLVEKKKTLDKFKEALKESKEEHSGHDDIFQLILEKEIENASEEPQTELASLDQSPEPVWENDLIMSDSPNISLVSDLLQVIIF